ncbi:MAG: RluA family pseudouridine synthase [Pseudomonadota bacterium]
MPSEGISFYEVYPTADGLRLDQFAALICPDHSRSFLSTLIRSGNIRVEGKLGKPSQKVHEGDKIWVQIPEPADADYRPEPMDLDILYEDSDLLVLNKPAGLVVHPGPGHARATLVNGLLHHCTDLSPIGGVLRPGIVHRLDRDTSGTMVVAKSATAHEHLCAQFKERTIGKTYLALIWGHFPTPCGRIDQPIGRHPVDRKKMSIFSKSARSAETLWRARKTYPDGTLLEVDLKTGRTHQIRVHCAAEGHPIVGDPVYGNRKPPGAGGRPATPAAIRLRAVTRQMLHAWRLSFIHPVSGDVMRFKSPLPVDMIRAIWWMSGRDAYLVHQSRAGINPAPYTIA